MSTRSGRRLAAVATALTLRPLAAAGGHAAAPVPTAPATGTPDAPAGSGGVSLRYSLARLLRFWPLRLSYEQQQRR